jgi:UDP-N-acetylmuramoylalanine--D-glutamate ligase
VYPDQRLAEHHLFALTYLEPLLPEDPEEKIEDFHLQDIQAPVVLELSSWQLADLSGKGILRPKIAVITNIMHDHQNYYTSMEEYVRDKKVIYENQSEGDATVINFDDPYAVEFARETRVSIYFFSKKPLPHGLPGAWLEKDGGVFSHGQGDAVQILPEHLSVIGVTMTQPLIAGNLHIFRLKPKPSWPACELQGVEHRSIMF